MHRIVPEMIVENYRARQFQGSFRAAGMFLDLSGFSTLTDVLAKKGQHGAEILVGLMRSVFDPLVASVFEHSGRIIGFAGDGIMALFPVESGERAAALNALASAWKIQQRLAAQPLNRTPYGVFSISAKIGLSLGDVSWGILPSSKLEQAAYYFRGDAVEESANAEHLARAGEINLSHSIVDVLRADIRVTGGASFNLLTGVRSELPSPVPVRLPPVDLSVSRAFYPEPIVTRDARGEFRQAVNLFIRIPELSDEKLQKFVQKLFELREQYGGMLTRLDFGDKGCNLLMLWGAPVAYENDIGRALNFLLDLKAGVDFPVTSGVTYYLAHAGFLGGEIFECYTCYGWGVNLASRFMMSAPDGSTWIDERVARRVKNRFDFQYRGAQNFKGFDEEQKVYVLQGRKSHEDAPYQGEFVGREAEMSRLAEFLQPLWEGKSAGLCSIWGDAGIGKSRLVYELRISPLLKDRKALWAFCHSDQVLRHSLNPFRYWLLNYFDLASKPDDAARKALFDQKLDALIARAPDAELASDLGRLRSALGALLDLAWPDSFYEKLDAEGRYNNTLLALIALFKAECLRQPVIIFIEDAQFLDEDTRAFLPRLKRALADFPFAALVSSRRAGSDSMLDASLSDATVELGALPLQALSGLAEIYLGGAASPELMSLLQERSEGNPYFAEQLLVYFQEEGFLEMGERGWRAARALYDSSLPADIRALLMSHFDQLNSAVRDVALAASVLGREFDTPVLSAMLKEDAALPGLLKEAERAEIFSPVGQNRFTFRHGLLRDAAYSMQTSARKREIHAVVVDVLERLFPEELQRYYGELAHHSESAELTDKALHYLSLAGRRASELYQNAQAVDYFTRALALLSAGELHARSDLLLERVEVYKRVGNRKAQLEDVEAVKGIADELGNQPLLAKALLQHAHYSVTVGNYAQAQDLSRRIMEMGQVADHAIMLESYSLMASAVFRLGKLDASMAKAREGLILARKFGSKRSEAHLLNGMGLVSIEQNESLNAMEYLSQAIEIAREISDVPIEISALNNLGNVAAYLGDYPFARECYERSYDGARTRGDRHGESLTLGNLGWISGRQGDFAASRVYHQQALSLAREVGSPLQEAYMLINLSAALAAQGDAVAALECARLGHALCVKTNERSGEAWALLNMGHARLLAEEFAEARLAYEQCLQIREELRQPNLAAEALSGLAQTAFYRGDDTSLSRHVDAILSILSIDKELSGAEEPLRIYYACYQSLVRMNDPRSKAILQNALKLLEAQASKLKDEGARHLYVESVPWRRALQSLKDAGK